MAVNVIAIEQQAAEVRKTEKAIAKVKVDIYMVQKRVKAFIATREGWLGHPSLGQRGWDAIRQSIQEVVNWGKAEEARLLQKLVFLAGLLEIQKKALAAIIARPPEVDRYGRSRQL